MSLDEELLTTIHLQVLERIKPSQDERARLLNTFEVISSKIKAILDKENIFATLELSGSLSRDTWISGSRDIDLFVKLPYESPLKPENILHIIEKNTDNKWIKKFARHPYLATVFEGIDVEIIPCYEYQPGRELRSAVDRSPEHRKFILENLPAGARDEVLLLKQFMRGIGTYGAEIRTHGFSGYLLELLIILNDGSFLEVLKNAKNLGENSITFDDTLTINEAKYADDCLLIIDPTDPNRNVASAVDEVALEKFKAAAYYYLNHPSIEFFFPKKIAIEKEQILEMKKAPLELTALFFKEPNVVEDILWGQIRKIERSIYRLLVSENMNPIMVDTIISSNDIMVLIITIEKLTKKLTWQQGPPVDNVAQEEFLRKYQKNNAVEFGPTVKEGRWVVLLKQKQLTVIELLKEAIKDQSITQTSHLNYTKAKFYSREALIEHVINDKEKLRFIYTSMKGKPPYL